MTIVAKILGGILLLFWILCIPVARRYIRTAGSVMYSTVFQYNILPFIVGVLLILSGNLLTLIIFPIAWVLSRFYPTFFMFVFPLIFGGVFGSKIFTDFFPNSKIWFYGGGVIGVLFMFIFCTVMVAIISPISVEKDADEQNNK